MALAQNKYCPNMGVMVLHLLDATHSCECIIPLFSSVSLSFFKCTEVYYNKRELKQLNNNSYYIVLFYLENTDKMLYGLEIYHYAP